MSKKHHTKKCSCRPFYYDCECESNLDVLDMIKAAMKDEKKAAKFYHCMAKKAQCEADKELFKNIRMDEKRHYRLLQEILRDLTCECYCVDCVKIKEPQGFCRALKRAICDEMQDVTDYENLAYYLCDMQHKEIICAIINDEREHAQQLAALYQFAQECACNAKSKHNQCNCACTCQSNNHNHRSCSSSSSSSCSSSSSSCSSSSSSSSDCCDD